MEGYEWDSSVSSDCKNIAHPTTCTPRCKSGYTNLGKDDGPQHTSVCHLHNGRVTLGRDDNGKVFLCKMNVCHTKANLLMEWARWRVGLGLSFDPPMVPPSPTPLARRKECTATVPGIRCSIEPFYGFYFTEQSNGLVNPSNPASVDPVNRQNTKDLVYTSSCDQDGAVLDWADTGKPDPQLKPWTCIMPQTELVEHLQFDTNRGTSSTNDCSVTYPVQTCRAHCVEESGYVLKTLRTCYFLVGSNTDCGDHNENGVVAENILTAKECQVALRSLGMSHPEPQGVVMAQVPRGCVLEPPDSSSGFLIRFLPNSSSSHLHASPQSAFVCRIFYASLLWL